MLISLDFLVDKNACKEGVDWYRENIKEPVGHNIIITKLVETNDLDKIRWANWFLTRILNRGQNVSYAIYAVDLVLNIFENNHCGDNRPRLAIEKAKKHLGKTCATNNVSDGDVADYATDAAVNAAYAAFYAANAAGYVTTAANFAIYATNAAYATDHEAAYQSTCAVFFATSESFRQTLIKIINYGLTLLED